MMDYKIERFTAGFGICFKHPSDFFHVSWSRSDNNLGKLGRSIPILSLVLTIVQMVQERQSFKDSEASGIETYKRLGTRAFDLRGILYGSVIGIPVGLAFDVVGTVLQAIYAIRNRSKSSAPSGSN